MRREQEDQKHGTQQQLQRKLQARGGGQSGSQRQRQPDGARAGHQQQELARPWIKQYGKPLAVETASVKELSARVRQLERQLAMREGQIEVLKKAIGIVSEAEKNGSR